MDRRVCAKQCHTTENDGFHLKSIPEETSPFLVKMETTRGKVGNEENIPVGREGQSCLLDLDSSWWDLVHFLCHYRTILEGYCCPFNS